MSTEPEPTSGVDRMTIDYPVEILQLPDSEPDNPPTKPPAK
jgi:hypothetical protein